jgi:hypothetical protein
LRVCLPVELELRFTTHSFDTVSVLYIHQAFIE